MSLLQNNTTTLRRKAENRNHRKFSSKSKKSAFCSFQKAAKKQQKGNSEFYTPYISERDRYNPYSPDGLSIEEQDKKLINTKRCLRELYGHMITPHPKI